MKDLIKNNIYFFAPFILFFISGLIVLFSVDKIQLHIWMNGFHSTFFDYFFQYITHLGDGITAGIIIGLFLLIRIRYFLFSLAGTVLSVIIVQLCKNFFFSDFMRPVGWFHWNEKFKLYIVEGVDMNGYNSFPSGHTTTAFCIFLSIAFIVKNNYLKFALFFLALVTGYSRVYLSQHFFMDVVAGSMLAVVLTTMFYFVFNKSKSKWMDVPLYKAFNKSN